jgi:hypothetical protein
MAKSLPTSPTPTDTDQSDQKEPNNRLKNMKAMFPHHSMKLPEKKVSLKIPHVDQIKGPQALPPAVRASTRSIPIPPLLPGMRATLRRIARVPSAAFEKLPLSAGPAPTKKMKMLFWNKLNEEKGLWEEVNKIHVGQLQINFQKLEEKFAIPEESTATNTSGPGGNSSVGGGLISHEIKKKKNLKISIIDSKRSHLMEISLNRIKKLPDEIATLLIQLNPDHLTLDLTEIFLNILPTSKEIELIKSFHGEISTLGLVEQVVLTMSTIPRLEKRLWCHRIVFVWPHALDKSIGQLNILEKGCQELLSPDHQSAFINLFSYILSIGNYLNSGTHRVAHAIHLESLLKLSTIKANPSSGGGRGQKETLLHYILSEMISHSQTNGGSSTVFNNITTLTKQFKYLFLLSDINYQQIQLEYKQSVDDYQRVKNEYDLLARPGAGTHSSSGDMNSFLQQRLEEFLVLSQERILFLDQYFQNINQQLADTFLLFGEKYVSTTPTSGGSSIGPSPSDGGGSGSSSSDSCQKFFLTLIEFLNLIQKSCEDLEKWSAEDESRLLQQQQQQESQRLAQLKLEKKIADEDASDSDSEQGDIFEMSDKAEEEHEENLVTKENLFSRFRNQQTGTADDLISQLKRKMHRRQSKPLKTLNSMTIEEKEQYLQSVTNGEPAGGTSSSSVSYAFAGLKKVPQGERKMI